GLMWCRCSCSCFHHKLVLHSFPTRRSSDLIAMHVSTTADSKREARIKKEFKERFPDIHFTIVNTEYRSVENPVIRYVDLVSKESDRKSTRLNSSHVSISYAVFFLKKKDNKV